MFAAITKAVQREINISTSKYKLTLFNNFNDFTATGMLRNCGVTAVHNVYARVYKSSD